MKVGFRTPNLKKRVRARTTGSLKRKTKKMINPLYGKKGMGFIKNPGKSIKDSMYHKVTVDPINFACTNKKITLNYKIGTPGYNKVTIIILCALGFIGLGGIHDFYLGSVGKGIIKLLTINWFFIGTIIDLIKILQNSY